MSVENRHPLYEKHLPLWEKCRDAAEGEEAVKQKGQVHLPMLSGQEKHGEYQAYKKRASFFGATGRTADGLIGAIMRKDPEMEIPDNVDALKERLGAKGESFDEVLNDVLDEDTIIGRIGLLVDAPADDDKAEPYVAIYEAEDITNWDYEKVEGRKTPSLIVLREYRKKFDPEDPVFGNKKELIYRVLRLSNNPLQDIESPEGVEPEDTFIQLGFSDGEMNGEDWFYWQEIHVKDEDKEEWFVEQIIMPRMAGGRALNRIPFTVINSEDLNLEPSKPPLLDLVNVNLSHYRNSADLEHGRHFTALPTPWTAGFDNADDELFIGSTTAWCASDPGATAGFLEFTGKGLGHLAEGMRDKEKQMAVLGARLLESREKQAESGEAMKIRTGGEQSTLARLSMTVSRGLSRVLWIVADWMVPIEEDKVTVELNKDFNVTGLDAQTITALMHALQSGHVSWNTWFFNLKRGELIPPGVTEEDEAGMITEGLPGIEAGLMISPKDQAEADEARRKAEEEDDDEEDEEDEEKEDEKE